MDPTPDSTATNTPGIVNGRWVFPVEAPARARKPRARRTPETASLLPAEPIPHATIERRSAVEAVPGIVYGPDGRPAPQHSEAEFVETARTVLAPQQRNHALFKARNHKPPRGQSRGRRTS